MHNWIAFKFNTHLKGHKAHLGTKCDLNTIKIGKVTNKFPQKITPTVMLPCIAIGQTSYQRKLKLDKRVA